MVLRCSRKTTFGSVKNVFIVTASFEYRCINPEGDVPYITCRIYITTYGVNFLHFESQIYHATRGEDSRCNMILCVNVSANFPRGSGVRFKTAGVRRAKVNCKGLQRSSPSLSSSLSVYLLSSVVGRG